MDTPLLDIRSYDKADLPPIEGYMLQGSQEPGKPILWRYELIEVPKVPIRQVQEVHVPQKKRPVYNPRREVTLSESDSDEEATPKLPDRGAMPGEPGDESTHKRCFNNQCMILTYKTHIPKTKYKEWFKNEIVPKYSGRYSESNRVIKIEMAHETGDQQNPYPHTHVVFKCTDPIYTRNARALDWEGIHPNWNYIKTKRHEDFAFKYLAKEDPENVHLIHDNQAWKGEVERSANLRDALKNTKCSPSEVSGIMAYFGIMSKIESKPRIALENMLRWQLEVIEEMDSNSKPRPPLPKIVDPADRKKKERIPIPQLAQLYDPRDRRLYLVLDRKGGAGKTQLIKALKYSDHDRFLVMQGIPPLRDFATIALEAQASGWTGDTIIFNLTRTQVDYKVHSTLEAAIDGFVTATKYKGGSCLYQPNNVWIFSNEIPRLDKVTMDRWKIYSVDADFKKGDMSWLEPVSTHDAMREYIALHPDDGLFQDEPEYEQAKTVVPTRVQRRQVK